MKVIPEPAEAVLLPLPADIPAPEISKAAVEIILLPAVSGEETSGQKALPKVGKINLPVPALPITAIFQVEEARQAVRLPDGEAVVSVAEVKVLHLQVAADPAEEGGAD